MTKLILYPFLNQCVPLVNALKTELKNEIEGIEICGIIPDSISCSVNNVSRLCNSTANIKVRLYTLNEMPDQSDKCIFLELPTSHSNAIESFVCSIRSWLENKQITSYKLPSEAIRACGGNCTNPKLTLGEFKITRPEMNRIAIPVIGVCGVFSLFDTTNVTVMLKEYLSKDLTVSTVYTSEIHKGWGYNYLDVGFLESLSFDNRIFYTNAFVDKVIKTESSDVVIVEIPNAVIGMDPYHLMGGGEYPFIFSQAIDFDYTICCVPINGSEVLPLKRLESHLKTKYGMRYISYHISNQYLFFDRDLLYDKIQCMFMNNDYVIKKTDEFRKKNTGFQIYNLLRGSDLQKWRESI